MSHSLSDVKMPRVKFSKLTLEHRKETVQVHLSLPATLLKSCKIQSTIRPIVYLCIYLFAIIKQQKITIRFNTLK